MPNGRERRLERQREQQVQQAERGEGPFPPTPSGAHLQVSQSHSTTLSISPLPSPEELAKYQEVDPALVTRLLDVVDRQTNHRMALEVEAQKFSFALARRGQICALTIGLAGLGVVAALGHFGHGTAASIVGAVDLLGLVATFVQGSKHSARPPPK